MKIKVLIAEDEALLAMSYQMSLELKGCEVVGIATTGQQAIDMANSAAPDIVLMDIKLKGSMDGIDAAIQIKKIHNIPIIYITGNTDDRTRERAFLTHPLRYLEKPVESSLLCEIIEQVMN